MSILEERTGLTTENARWAVESWAQALGVPMPGPDPIPGPDRTIPDSPPPPPPPPPARPPRWLLPAALVGAGAVAVGGLVALILVLALPNGGSDGGPTDTPKPSPSTLLPSPTFTLQQRKIANFFLAIDETNCEGDDEPFKEAAAEIKCSFFLGDPQKHNAAHYLSFATSQDMNTLDPRQCTSW